MAFHNLGLPGGSVGKESACQCRRCRFDPRLERSSGEGNGNPLQYLAWEIPWRVKPGGLESMGLQRVGHDLVTKQQQQFHNLIN